MRTTPEVYKITRQTFSDLAVRAPALLASWTTEEVEETNRRVAVRLNMDAERVQEILTWGPR